MIEECHSLGLFIVRFRLSEISAARPSTPSNSLEQVIPNLLSIRCTEYPKFFGIIILITPRGSIFSRFDKLSASVISSRVGIRNVPPWRSSRRFTLRGSPIQAKESDTDFNEEKIS